MLDWNKFTKEQQIGIGIGIALACIIVIAGIVSLIIYFITDGTMNIEHLSKNIMFDEEQYIRNRSNDQYMYIDSKGIVRLGNVKQKWSIKRFVGKKIQINSDNGIDLYFKDRGFKSNVLLGNADNWPGKSQIYNIFEIEPLTQNYFTIKIYRNVNCKSNKCLQYDEKNFYMDYEPTKNVVTPHGSPDFTTSQWYID